METTRNTLFSETTNLVIDHLVLLMVVMTSLQGRLELAIAGLAVYFIGQHPRYLTSKGENA